MGLYNVKDKDKINSEAGSSQNDDFWQVQNNLKIERFRNRVEKEAEKEARMKTPGELALMFMGINKIAHDLLIENPMTGYMNEIIFTRILGNDDILEATTWKDCS